MAWLRDNGTVVVSRQRTRVRPRAVHRDRDPVRHQGSSDKVVDEDRGEVRLYCYSEERAKKEEGIARRFADRFESEPEAPRGAVPAPTRKGLTPSGSGSGPSGTLPRAGRITPWTRRRPHSAKAVAVSWKHKPLARHPLTHPGVHSPTPMSTTGIHRPCGALSTMLTDLASRVPLSQVRTRPPPVQLPQNPAAPTHLFDHRHRLPTGPLPSAGASPNTESVQLDHSARILQGQHSCHRLSPPKDGRTLHVRKATRAENHNSKSTPLSGSPPRTRWGHQIGLKYLNSKCSATRQISPANPPNNNHFRVKDGLAKRNPTAVSGYACG